MIMWACFGVCRTKFVRAYNLWVLTRGVTGSSNKKIIKVTIHDVEINHFFSYNNN